MKSTKQIVSIVCYLLVFAIVITLFPTSAYASSLMETSGCKTIAVYAGSSKPGSFSASSDKSTYTTADDITITWKASKGATKYGLTVVNDSNNKVVFDKYVSGTSKNIGKLPKGQYRFQMAAYNNYGSSPLTKMAYFKVNDTTTTSQPSAGNPPDAPVSNNEPNFDAKDNNGNLYYADFLKMTSGGCVVYALTRVREKLGYYIGCKMLTLNNKALSSGDGKDVVSNFARSDQATKGIACANSQTSNNYTLLVHDYKGLSRDDILAAAQNDIQNNSIVSFNSAGSVDGNKGHVAFVEYVERINGQTTVYFTEGGTLDKTDGKLKNMNISEFVTRGGGMNGIATYVLMP